MGTIADEKQALREKLHTDRKAFSISLTLDDHLDIAEAIVKNVQSVIDLKQDLLIGSYVSYKYELDTTILNRMLLLEGLRLAYPRVNVDHSMSFCLSQDTMEMETGLFGVRQPLSSLPVVQPDVLLVPLLGFDSHCNRIGYGKGHFDRYLDKSLRERNVLAIGVAYDMQKVDKIPTEPTDVRLDAVVTEKEIYT